MMLMDAKELQDMPTLCVGQCCSLKIEQMPDENDHSLYRGLRVWLCRVGGGVTVEQCRDGKWVRVAGGCQGGGEWWE